jgi:Holliday junction resolvasome RuvABC endonuclease subunit
VKTILTLDPGQSCGYSVAKIDGDHCEIIEYGFIDVDNSSPYMGDWCIDLQRRLSEINDRISADEVAVEDYFYSSRFKQGANVNPAYRAAIHMWCRSRNMHYEILNISNWKVFIAGRSTPTKLQKQKWGASPAKKLMVVEALWKRFNIRFPNHSISENTGKPIIFRFDVVDAVAQGMYAAFARYNCKTYTCSVPVPPDVTFKKTNTKQFVYEDLV